MDWIEGERDFVETYEKNVAGLEEMSSNYSKYNKKRNTLQLEDESFIMDCDRIVIPW